VVAGAAGGSRGSGTRNSPRQTGQRAALPIREARTAISAAQPGQATANTPVGSALP
jgi:hypothetical protein